MQKQKNILLFICFVLEISYNCEDLEIQTAVNIQK